MMPSTRFSWWAATFLLLAVAVALGAASVGWVVAVKRDQRERERAHLDAEVALVFKRMVRERDAALATRAVGPKAVSWRGPWPIQSDDPAVARPALPILTYRGCGQALCRQLCWEEQGGSLACAADEVVAVGVRAFRVQQGQLMLTVSSSVPGLRAESVTASMRLGPSPSP